MTVVNFQYFLYADYLSFKNDGTKDFPLFGINRKLLSVDKEKVSTEIPSANTFPCHQTIKNKKEVVRKKKRVMNGP